MPGAKKMVTGFNHNIRHRGKMYHIQTEDSGLQNPHIITHLFLGGNILASRKTSYADIVGADNLGQVVRELMEEQHKEMLRNLVNGVYEDIDPNSSAPSEGPPPNRAPSPAPRPVRAAAPIPRPAPAGVPGAEKRGAGVVARKVSETLFGEDLISEKSLDEVILSYLAEDLSEKKS